MQAKTHYKLQTPSLYLLPYKKSYIKQYNSWFTLYPDLLHLTGSEPLTLEQEIENHRSWLEDPWKCTFIVFRKEEGQGIGRMVGDVNLFFSQWIEPNQAEINIMIAVPQERGKGFSKQLLPAIQLFSKAVHNRDTIIAKIKNDNLASIKFFEKMKYQFVQDNHHHGEKQYRKVIPETREEARKKLEEIYGLEEIKDVAALYQ